MSYEQRVYTVLLKTIRNWSRTLEHTTQIPCRKSLPSRRFLLVNGRHVDVVHHCLMYNLVGRPFIRELRNVNHLRLFLDKLWNLG